MGVLQRLMKTWRREGTYSGPEFWLVLEGGRFQVCYKWWWVPLFLRFNCGGKFLPGGVRWSLL